VKAKGHHNSNAYDDDQRKQQPAGAADIEVP
jgi:hypothetical protein